MALTLKRAQAIIEAGLRRGRDLRLPPLCIAVVDAGGALVALAREDGASFFRPHIAIGKAFSAVAFQRPTSATAERAAANPAFFTSLASLSEGKIIPVAGGCVIDEDGRVVGASASAAPARRMMSASPWPALRRAWLSEERHGSAVAHCCLVICLTKRDRMR